MNSDNLGIIDINKCIYPGENIRFWIAILATIPAILLYFFITYLTMGVALIIIPIIIFFSWFITRLLRASLLGSCIEVSPDNFPQIYKLLEDIRKYLDYPKKIEAYVYQNGDVNAFLIKKFRTRMILLPHELLVDMSEGEGQIELIWILARSIGHLKAKHLSLWGINDVIDAFEKLFVLNIFLYPYERATQYSGDRIGLAICSNLNASLTAMNKLMVGNVLSKKVSLIGELKQNKELKGSFFAWVAECLSTHPHTTKRIFSLIKWSKDYNTKLYTKFIDNHPEIKHLESELLLIT